jgi:TM2 domain-containing membrane protein YozV
MRDSDFELDDWDLSDRGFVLTLLLCALLGVLGIHRFYVGKVGTGLLMLLTGGLGGIWWIVDLVLIATGNFRDKEGLYIRP